jgi:energy-coupling factor transporter ATP-binding protein EcfA2
VSLTVGGGEIVTLLGANGSGKSTTRRAISAWCGRRQGGLAGRPATCCRRPSPSLGVAARGYVLETGRVVAPAPAPRWRPTHGPLGYLGLGPGEASAYDRKSTVRPHPGEAT